MAGGARDEGVGTNEGGSAQAECGCIFPSQPQHPNASGKRNDWLRVSGQTPTPTQIMVLRRACTLLTFRKAFVRLVAE